MPMNRLAGEVPGCRYGLQVAQVEYEAIKYIRKLKKENQKLKKELKEYAEKYGQNDTEEHKNT